MSKVIPTPPPGIEDMTPDETVEHVQDLCDYIPANTSKVPAPDRHRSILDERLNEYLASPDEGEMLGRAFGTGYCVIWPTEKGVSRVRQVRHR